MGINSTAYKIVFLLHILFAIVGFGAVVLNGIYGAEAKKRKGAEGLAIFQANHRVSMVAEGFILLVPVMGVGLVFISDGVWAFSQMWVWLAMVVFALALAVNFGLLLPAVKRHESLMVELAGAGASSAGAAGPPPQLAQLEANGKKLAAFGMTLQIALVTILVLMIWKPGL